jgi:hypothetical protein
MASERGVAAAIRCFCNQSIDTILALFVSLTLPKHSWGFEERVLRFPD